MITGIEAETEDGRRARVFFTDLPTSQDAASTAVAARFWDDETDIERSALLSQILRHQNVRALAFPTSGLPGTIQLFLRDEQTGRRIFACVLVTGERLRELLRVSSPLVEGFSLQVMPGERLSMQGIHAGCQAWVERCFPKLVLPDITVQHWTSAGISEDLLKILLPDHKRMIPTDGMAENDGDASIEIAPAAIVQPPYEAAA